MLNASAPSPKPPKLFGSMIFTFKVLCVCNLLRPIPHGCCWHNELSCLGGTRAPLCLMFRNWLSAIILFICGDCILPAVQSFSYVIPTCVLSRARFWFRVWYPRVRRAGIYCMWFGLCCARGSSCAFEGRCIVLRSDISNVLDFNLAWFWAAGWCKYLVGLSMWHGIVCVPS